MTLKEKVKAVEDLYNKLDQEITEFKKESGIKCLSGCGHCCNKADIEATVLEFLPLAHYWYENKQAEQQLELLMQKEDGYCTLFSLHISGSGGMCNNYPHRGLICRLFGYGATKDKYGVTRLATCKFIKEQAAYQETVEKLKNGLPVPYFSSFYNELADIDFTLGHKFYPVNKAIQLALEKVLQYYSYHDSPINDQPHPMAS